METRKLGKSGLEVSELALGTMQFGWTAGEETAYAILDTYADAGGNLIDTANIYSQWVDGNGGGESEEIIGRWMKYRGNRQRFVLASKVRGRMWEGPNGEGLSRAHIFRAIEDSLRRLQTDYIDLYQTHWFDADTPVEETMRALDDLVQAGKVRYLGCSNHPAWRLAESLWVSDKHNLASYVSLQPHYNLAHRAEFEREMAELVGKYALGVLPYSPLGSGFLTGKYRKGQPLPDSARAESVRKRYLDEPEAESRNFALVDQIESIGRSHGQGIPQVALAWLLSNPLVTAPIIGANSVGQLKGSLAATGCRLSKEEREMLDDLSDWRKT